MRTSVFTCSLLLTLAACGPAIEQSSPDASQDAGATVDTSLDAGAMADAGLNDAGVPDAGTAPLPNITSVVVVTHGSIRVQWANPNPGCDGLKLMRSKDGATAVLAGQPTATAVEFTDAPGHASGTYCYRLDCARSGTSQGLSNQLCATQ